MPLQSEMAASRGIGDFQSFEYLFVSQRRNGVKPDRLKSLWLIAKLFLHEEPVPWFIVQALFVVLSIRQYEAESYSVLFQPLKCR